MSNENQTLPTSLEDAMRMLREDNQQDTPDDVGGGSVDQGTNMEPIEESANAQAEEVSTQSATQSQLWAGVNGTNAQPQESVTTDGGSATVSNESAPLHGIDPSPRYDYEKMTRQYLDDIVQKAKDSTNDLFRQNGISKISIGDLYRRDESGRVSFDNPDDPNRPFESRAAAQQWIDAINSQIDEDWNRYATQYQNQFFEEAKPALRMIAFGPTYEKMSKIEQEVFDEIISPYIVTVDGVDIGYSCDLNRMKDVAVGICSKMNQSAPQSQGTVQNQQNPASGPALDATTSGSNSAQGNKLEEPKDIQDAMRMMNEQKKQKK